MVRDKYKKPQCHLKICDKLKIIALYEEAKISMRKFTELVQIKLGLKVGRVTIQRILKQKEEFLAVPEYYRSTRCRGLTEVQSDFEKHLYETFLQKKRRTGFNYETIKILGLKILLEEDGYDCLRGKLQFSRQWFKKWLQTYKVGWAMIHGSKKYFPKEVLKEYRKEYREKIRCFQPEKCYNFDESAFLHSWLGRMSYIPMNGVDDAFVEKGSDKLRMTVGTFINADGSDNYQSFIVKSYPRDLIGIESKFLQKISKKDIFFSFQRIILVQFQKGTIFLAQKYCPFYNF